MRSGDEAKLLELVAGFMALAARTAPKSAGQDFVEVKVITGSDQLEKLADAMLEFGKETGKINFDRDGENIRRSAAVLLLSLREPGVVGLNCGACGYDTCNEMKKNRREGPEFNGPLCAWRLLDLGIALGSAVKTASLHNADNRIMYRAGVVAKKLGLMEGDPVVAVPLSATGKNIYFDR